MDIMVIHDVCPVTVTLLGHWTVSVKLVVDSVLANQIMMALTVIDVLMDITTSQNAGVNNS